MFLLYVGKNGLTTFIVNYFGRNFRTICIYMYGFHNQKQVLASAGISLAARKDSAKYKFQHRIAIDFNNIYL